MSSIDINLYIVLALNRKMGRGVFMCPKSKNNYLIIMPV